MNIDGYEILEKIGEGGMAQVFAAIQKSLHRRVAIKVLNKELLGVGSNVEQFLQEAILAGKLRSRNLVTIYDAGNQDGQYYLVMEYLPGQELFQLIHENRPDPDTVLKIAIDIATGLMEAHSNGIIHRDIKPSNIIVEYKTNRAVIMDFGLATAKFEEKLTSEASFVTYEYQPPEAMEGYYSNKTDIYGYGLILFELITGQLPYQAINFGELKKIKESGRYELEQLRILGVKEEVISLISSCLSPKPEIRPDAREILELLDGIEGSLFGVVVPPSPKKRAVFPVKLVIVVASIAFIGFVALLISLFSDKPSSGDRLDRNEVVVPPPGIKTKAPTLDPKDIDGGKSSEFSAIVNINGVLWQSVNSNYDSGELYPSTPDGYDYNPKLGLWYNFEDLNYACPDGFHAATIEEWQSLITALRRDATLPLKMNLQLRPGYFDFLNGNSIRKGSLRFWCGPYFDDENSEEVYTAEFSANNDTITRTRKSLYKMNVRCVKD